VIGVENGARRPSPGPGRTTPRRRRTLRGGHQALDDLLPVMVPGVTRRPVILPVMVPGVTRRPVILPVTLLGLRVGPASQAFNLVNTGFHPRWTKIKNFLDPPPRQTAGGHPTHTWLGRSGRPRVFCPRRSEGDPALRRRTLHRPAPPQHPPGLSRRLSPGTLAV
jgi:hypothetical protein